MLFLISLINFIIRAFSLLVIVKVVLSYFMSPYHPVREFIDRIVEPFLAPIRRILPPTGMLDFSPVVLLILLWLLGGILTTILVSLV